VTCLPANQDADNLWKNGETRTMNIELGNAATALVEGSKKQKFNICFKTYSTRSGSTFAKQVCGELYATVE
jgi:hypothetical protein